MALDVAAIQRALGEQQADGWLLYDLRERLLDRGGIVTSFHRRTA